MAEQPVPRRTKAILAAAVAGTGSLAVAAVDNAITLGEALVVVATAVAAAAAVYGVNRSGGTDDQDDEQGDHEAG
jgi:hypothetical protein